VTSWIALLSLSPVVVAAAGSPLLALYGWRRRPAPGAVPFAALMLGVSAWAAAYAVQVWSTELAVKNFWGAAKYLGIVSVPVSFLWFALEYTGRTRWLQMRYLALLSVMPALTILAAWTNDAHGLMWQRVTVGAGALLSARSVRHGAWFWVHTAYAYALLVVTTALLTPLALRGSSLFRGQAVAFLAGLLAPWLGNVTYLSGMNPVAPLDLTPFGFAAAGGVFAWGLSRFRVLDIVPVARNMVVESMRDAVIVLDLGHRVVELNPAAMGLVGRPASQVLGQPAERVLPRWAEFPGVAQGGAEGQCEVMLPSEGGDRHFDVRVSPIRQASGRLTGRLVLMRDITKRKLAEHELRAAHAELQQRVEELRRAKDAAELASRAKSQFLANMSHEIRTPMNGVVGMIELLRATPLTERQGRLVDTVHRSADTLVSIINDILDFGKIEAGKLELDHREFGLREAVAEVVDLLAPRAQAKGLVLTCTMPETMPTRVTGDPVRVRQVLTNLVGNAVKFTEQGEVTVQLAVVDLEVGSALVRFEVRDTGIGIAPALQHRIFDMFAQADGSTTRRYGGTGLGLAIAKQLAELMGGAIGVDSAPGRGSTFWFTARLGMSPGAEHEAAGPGGRQESPSGPGDGGSDSGPAGLREPADLYRRLDGVMSCPPPLLLTGSGLGAPAEAWGTARVLVAEDNPVNQEVATGMLEALGCRVDIAANGREALDRAQRVSYDVILMDCQMPEMDGFEATRCIREQVPAGDRVPIIALTAHALVEDRQRCLDAGMDDYLSKPFSLDAMRAVLRRSLPSVLPENGAGACRPRAS
jgi:PAS domain S-box-containing protein